MKIFRGASLILFLVLGLLLLIWQGIKLSDWLGLADKEFDLAALAVDPAIQIPLITLVAGMIQYFFAAKFPKFVQVLLAIAEPIIHISFISIFALIAMDTSGVLPDSLKPTLDSVNLALGRAGDLSWQVYLFLAPLGLRLLYAIFARVVIGKGVESKRGWRLLRSMAAVVLINAGIPLALSSAMRADGVNVGLASIALLFFVFVNWYLGRAMLHYFNSGATAFVSMRYLRKRPISLASVLGVAVGIGVLIVVSSIMNGFLMEYKDQIQASLSDIIIESYPETFQPGPSEVDSRVWEYYYTQMQSESEEGERARAMWQHALAVARDARVFISTPAYEDDELTFPDGTPRMEFPATRVPERPDASPSVEKLLQALDSIHGSENYDQWKMLPRHPKLGLASPENIWLSVAFESDAARTQMRKAVREEAEDAVFLQHLAAGNDFMIDTVKKREDVIDGAPRVTNLGPISGKNASGQTEEFTNVTGVDAVLEPGISALGDYAAKAEMKRFAIRYHVEPMLRILNFALIFEDPRGAPGIPLLGPVLPAPEQEYRIEYSEFENRYLQARRYAERSGQVRWAAVNAIQFRQASPGAKLLDILKRAIKEFNSTTEETRLYKALDTVNEELLDLVKESVAAGAWSEEELRSVEWNKLKTWPEDPAMQRKLEAAALVYMKDNFVDYLPKLRADLLDSLSFKMEFLRDTQDSIRASVAKFDENPARENEEDDSDGQGLDDASDPPSEAESESIPMDDGPPPASGPSDADLALQRDLRTLLAALDTVMPKLRAWYAEISAPSSEFMQAKTQPALTELFLAAQEQAASSFLRAFLDEYDPLLRDLGERELSNTLYSIAASEFRTSDSLHAPIGGADFDTRSLDYLLLNWEDRKAHVAARADAYSKVLPVRTRMLSMESIDEYLSRAQGILPHRLDGYLEQDESADLAHAKQYAGELLKSFIANRIEFSKGQQGFQRPNHLPSEFTALGAELKQRINTFITQDIPASTSLADLQGNLKVLVKELADKADALLPSLANDSEKDALRLALRPLVWNTGSDDYWDLRMPMPCLMVGDALADRINLTIGDSVKIMLARRRRGEDSNYGYSVLETSFRVTGVYRSGIFDDNLHTMYADYQSMTRLIGASAAQFTLGFKIKDYGPYDGNPEKLRREVQSLIKDQALIALKDRTNNPERAEAAARASYVDAFPNTRVSTWELEREKLIGAVERERTILELLLALIVMLSGVVILIVVYLTVVEKVKDIGILKALGASPWGIRSVFMFNALFIGLFGAALGSAIAILLSQNLPEIENWIDAEFNLKLFPPDVYYLTNVPSLKGMELWVLTRDIAVPAVLWSFFCGIVPAVLASKKNAVEALHSE